jgi:hypothetical protein
MPFTCSAAAALIADLASDWIGSEALRRRIFVENPSRLYEF